MNFSASCINNLSDESAELWKTVDLYKSETTMETRNIKLKTHSPETEIIHISAGNSKIFIYEVNERIKI